MKQIAAAQQLPGLIASDVEFPKMNIRTLLALITLSGAAGGAMAQTMDGAFGADPAGKSAGDVLLRLRAIGVIPETLSSSVSAIGGHAGIGFRF